MTSFPPLSPSHTHLYSPSLCICIYYASLFSLLTHTQSWEVSDATAADGNDSVEEHRAAVQVSMDEYMSSQYGASADAKAACAVYGTADGNLVVCCTGIATNLRNW